MGAARCTGPVRNSRLLPSGPAATPPARCHPVVVGAPGETGAGLTASMGLNNNEWIWYCRSKGHGQAGECE